MIDILTLSIGVGLIVSLLFAEFYGFKAGGLVVPGYFALFLTDPWRILVTGLIALITFMAIRLVASVVVVYGKRRTALAVLFGYVFGAGTRIALGDAGVLPWAPEGIEVIGYIIPGLIALWMDRQGVVETLTSLATVSIVARLALIVIAPNELEAFQQSLQQPTTSGVETGFVDDTVSDS